MMKKILLGLIVLLFSAFAVFAQTSSGAKKPTDADKAVVFDADGRIVRGAALGDSKTVSLADVLAEPGAFAGETVRVSGFVVRSCKKEGCWAELGVEKDSKTTVRVTMKDHGFFIPLASAGFKADAEGVFSVNTLSKEKVKHLVEDDGAVFEKINEDGTVTEISFEAAGIVLTKE